MDQAEPLRQLAQRLSPLEQFAPAPTFANTPRTIVVTSGKGGVGKSNVAVNLAISLAKLKKRVLIFDADLGMANVDILLGITPRFNIQHVVNGEKSLNEILFVGPEGVLILPGCSGIREIANMDEARKNSLLVQLEQFENRVDIIIVDTGPSISSNVLNFVLAAHEAVVVTSPEPTAVVDAYAMIKIINQGNPGTHIGLLKNMITSNSQAQQTHNTIDIIAKKFLNLDLENLGHVAYDPKVAKAVQQQVPFVLSYPSCRASQDIKALAMHLVMNTPANDRSVSFFSHLAGIFRSKEEPVPVRRALD